MTEYEMTVPANTSAELYLPISEEQAKSLTFAEGVNFIGMESRNGRDCAKFSVVAGRYAFSIPEIPQS